MAVNPNSNIIAITGGKGGVGKSVFAANLAFAFMESRQPVLLVDLDAQSCGDQNVILGMREVRTMSDVIGFTGAISQSNLPQVISFHPKNLGYIAAVRRPDENLNVQVDLAMKQLEALSNFFAYIIVDIGTSLGPLQLSVVERATTVLMVTVPEVLTLNQTLRQRNELLIAGVPSDMIQYVLNKISSGGLAPEKVEEIFKKRMIGSIPQDDATATGSLQRSTPFMLFAGQAPIGRAHSEVFRKLTGGVLQQLKALSRPQQLKFKKEIADSSSSQSAASRFKGYNKPTDARTALKLTVHAELIKAMDLKKGITDTQGDPKKEEELRRTTTTKISQILDKEASGVGREERAQILKEVLDEALGLGPLEALLDDPQVTEIMVNGFNKIYIEKTGIIQDSKMSFTSNHQLRRVIERIVEPLGRQINEANPYVDARLKDGSRVNAVIEPLSIDGPAVTIRKFSKKPVTVETYTKVFNAATANMMDFLRICVENHLNIIISGGTGSGKTTLLNTMSGFIPANERIVTIEDAAELQLKQDHVVRLETRPASREGSGAVTIRDLVRNSLRMRPDRIVVGECRDGAALDMLQAMNTGHDGSMTTIHANNPREAVARLETLCLMAGMELPARAIRENIAGAVDLIVQISRLSDGSRKIIDITEVQNLQDDKIILQPVFVYKEEGIDKNRKVVGKFQATGLIPKFIEGLQKRGIDIPRSIFSNDSQQSGQQPQQSVSGQQAVKKAVGGR